MKYTGGEAFVEALVGQEVKAIFCSPGTEWAPVWEALAKRHAQGRKEPEYFNCRHEILASSAAIGYAQKGGNMAALLLHTTSGLLHGSMAIHGAYMLNVPLLVCSGESVRFTEAKDGGQGYQWLHSLSDVGGPSRLAAPFVKWSQAITSRETLAGAIAQGCQIARTPPQGPVLLSVPIEYLQEEREEIMPHIPIPRTGIAPHHDDIERIAALLLSSQYPIIVTEHVGVQPQAVQKLVELAESVAIPVFEVSPAAVNFPKDHPLHAGYDITEAIREADLVLVLAAGMPWNPQRINLRPEASVLFIDDQAPYQRFPYWNYRAEMVLAADPLLVLEALVESLQAKGHVSAVSSDKFRHWQAKHDQMIVAWDEQARRFCEKKPIDPYWLSYAINEWLPAEAIVVREVITHTPALTRYLRRVRPGNYFMGNIKGLGSGMGVALGVKLASPNQPVLHFVGDGAFNYGPVLSALGFSQEYHLPVLTVVFNNGAYRAMQSAHLRLYPEGWASRTKTFYGVDIAPNPDYTQVMKAFGAYGERIEEPGEILPALGRAWAEIQKGRSVLLDVILDPGDPRAPRS